MKINKIDVEVFCGFKCLISGKNIFWDDDDIVDAIDSSCTRAVISSLCPECCAIGDLLLSEEWEKYYDRNASDMSLEEMIQSADLDAIAIEVVRSGQACGPFHETTYFLIPEDPLLVEFLLVSA
jgi:hypothetical protein